MFGFNIVFLKLCFMVKLLKRIGGDFETMFPISFDNAF
ncbi:hypothetical protein HPHPA9_0681 [Helicobacter pylori Hp A-9]|uniref:Uncharacterized protein n=1 Tax=Helicobacter pylori Hp A-9 TaxID=992034 RepID=I9RIS1_HELPX|nr:hypothetical protein HPHPA9_0681 [Helicobacter pylori Hp A-9]